MTSEEFSKFCKDMCKMIKEAQKQFRAVRQMVNKWRWKFAEIQINWGNAKGLWEKIKLLINGISNVKINFKVHKVDSLSYLLYNRPMLVDAGRRKSERELLEAEKAKLEAEKKKWEKEKKEQQRKMAEEQEKWFEARKAAESSSKEGKASLANDIPAESVGKLMGNIEKNFGWIFKLFSALGHFSTGWNELKKAVSGGRDFFKRTIATIKSVARVITSLVEKINILIGAAMPKGTSLARR